MTVPPASISGRQLNPEAHLLIGSSGRVRPRTTRGMSGRCVLCGSADMGLPVIAILAGWMCDGSGNNLGLGSLRLSLIRAVVASARTGGLSETGVPG
jgi:hypothetical protein